MTTKTDTACSATPLTLETDRQRLRLLPELGGSIGAWEVRNAGRWLPILRPWDGLAPDAYTFACFPLVPWSNRIGKGGFDQDGVFHPMHPNRAGEPYPIHGDGWLQPWNVAWSSRSDLTLELISDRFDGNPYRYRATQRFELDATTLTVTLTATHLGAEPLPYGLGLHPYFPREADTRLQMQCDGLWLCGADPIPVSHALAMPPTFDYRQPAPLDGPMIDHCFTGWDGRATITYPTRGVQVTLTMPDCPGYALMYRPPGYDYFCLEPITHPIDAFHMPDRPGLRVLEKDESVSVQMILEVHTL